jgi:hypothetical protein
VWTWPFLLHLLAFASVASFLPWSRFFPSPLFFARLGSTLLILLPHVASVSRLGPAVTIAAHDLACRRTRRASPAPVSCHYRRTRLSPSSLASAAASPGSSSSTASRPGARDRDQGTRPDVHEGLAPAPRRHLSPRRRGSTGPLSSRRHPWRSVDPRRRLDLGLHTHRRPVKSRPETSSVVPSSAACTSTPASSSVSLWPYPRRSPPQRPAGPHRRPRRPHPCSLLDPPSVATLQISGCRLEVKAAS